MFVCVRNDYILVGLRWAGILLNVIWRTRGKPPLCRDGRIMDLVQQTPPFTNTLKGVDDEATIRLYTYIYTIYIIHISNILMPCVLYKIFKVWDFGRCKMMSAKESKWRRVGGCFRWNQPLSYTHTTFPLQQPLEEIRGNIAFRKCVRANKEKDMLLKKSLYIYIYSTHLLLLRTEGNRKKYILYTYIIYICIQTKINKIKPRDLILVSFVVFKSSAFTGPKRINNIVSPGAHIYIFMYMYSRL